jgi:CHAT domain-containing protein
LTAGAALVELVRVQLLDFHLTGRDTTSRPSHYLAFVLTSAPENHAHLVDLGDADKIDRQVYDLRASLVPGSGARAIGALAAADGEATHAAKPKGDAGDLFRKRSRALYRRIFAPLRAGIDSARMVYISPDGELNRVPFEALADEQGHYLIEGYSFAYLSSGAELVKSRFAPASGTVVMASPDYDLGVRERKAGAGTLVAASHAPTTSAPDPVPYRGMRSCEKRGGRGWTALPWTAKEASEVRHALEGSPYAPVQVYAGKQALEDVLKRLPAPRVLHLATHGYFFPDQESATADRVARLESAELDERLARIRGTENPLLRSGLVLAGANAAGPESDAAGVEDGWVTAEEIGLLNLRGTELVVLSACETGLGDMRLGEGVSGLRRAFRYAGARTLVMSLFPVDDRATQELMGRFYRNLRAGRGRLEALRGAQFEMMRRKESASPFYWASFVLVGDPD